MSLRWKLRLRWADWTETRGVQVGLSAPLLTVYLLWVGRELFTTTNTKKSLPSQLCAPEMKLCYSVNDTEEQLLVLKLHLVL